MSLSTRTQSYIAAALFVALAALALIEPFDEPTQSIVQALIFFPTAIWAVYISYSCRDEVMIHASRAAFAHGTPIALAIVMLSTLAVRFWQPATNFVTTAAANSSEGLPPAITGFGMGVVFTFLALGLTIMTIYAIWWKRTQ